MPEAAAPLAQQNVDNADYSTEGLSLSIDCAEEAPFNDDERIAAALAQDPLLAHYALLGRIPRGLRAVGASPHCSAPRTRLVTSAIPTLLMTRRLRPGHP